MSLSDADDAETALFKSWAIKKIEAISDADSEVLADYVVALFKTEDSEVILRKNAVEGLKDFIQDHAEGFVAEVFQAIKTKSYDPTRPQPKPSAPIYAPPRRVSYEPPSLPNESRKRSYYDWDAEEGQNGRIPAFEDADRLVKYPRRGGKGHDWRGARMAQPTRGGFGGLPPYNQHLPPMQLPQMPAFEPNNFAAMMAMGQAMGLLPSDNGFGLNGYGMPHNKQRCRDYDTKGFCTRGVSCPYEHDDNALVVPPQSNEYDPNDASMFDITPSRVGHMHAFSPSNGRGSATGRTRGGAATYRGGGHERSGLSAKGQNTDRNVTSIVVEQIPEDHFDAQKVREFFDGFGKIEEVTMQPYKRLAIVRYDSYDSAKAAYSSPKSVFDNRFVKVYWYKPDSIPQLGNNGHAVAQANEDVNMAGDEPEIDYEEIARKQAEAQRKHDKKQKQREQVEKTRQELEDKLTAIDAERRKIAELIAKKTGKPVVKSEEDQQTAMLKAKLAELQREALSLGIDPDADDYAPYTHAPQHAQGSLYRGRGGYRGRGAYRGRGDYQLPYRGAYGGGGFTGGRVTMSLDNRPKTVAVTFANGQYQEHEEALRQYLMFNGLETATLAKHPERDDAVVVAFQQRYEAENLMAAAMYEGPLAASDLPKQLGNVVMAWYKPGDAVMAASNEPEEEYAKRDEEEETKPPADYFQASREDRDMDTYDE